MNSRKTKILLIFFLSFWYTLLFTRTAYADQPDLLLYLTCKGDKDTISLMKKDGKDLNLPTWSLFNLTALDLALAIGNWDIVEYLISEGMVPTERTFNYPCDKEQMKKLCQMYPQFKYSIGCRAAASADQWIRRCGLEEGWGKECGNILQN
jgi:hypothetical protein